MIKILNGKEKAEIEKNLREQFGIESIPGAIVKTGKERFFLFSGSFSDRQITGLERLVPVERVGVYFAKEVQGENAVKLSIEGTHALSPQIKKNTFELNKEQAEKWMHGSDIQIKTGKKGFFVIKHESDFLGTGKISELKIGNFIPKSRRLRVKG